MPGGRFPRAPYDAFALEVPMPTPPEPTAADAFVELLRPCALEDFLAGPYGRHPWHGRPDASSRRTLIDWEDVNRALDCARAWDERSLRLALHGRPVPAPDYCVPQEGPSGTVWRPAADLVERALRAGATLVASGIDGVIPAVGALAQSIEAVLPVRVQANLYLSSAGVAGFPLHDDSHDVLVVQLAGRKRWAVHAPTGGSASARANQASPVLEAADLLYLPQGWPHEAVAETDACMHLSFALVHLRLDDIARALVRALGDAGAGTVQPLHDLHLGAPAMATHIDELLRRLQALRADGAFAATVLRSLLDSRRSRPRHQLPVRPPSRGPGLP